MPKFRFYALKLCLICIIIYAIQILFSGFTELFVLNNRAFHNYEYWRFVTAVFLHGSIPHLLYNIFALGLFGSILEKLIRGKKFLLVFFLSGITANVISVNFYESSLGASGAIYGILGCLTIIRPLMMVWAFGFPMPMFIASILWIIGGILGIFMPGNVGHIAHLSGIVVGFIFGLFLILKRKRKKYSKIKIPGHYLKKWEEKYMR